MTRLGHGTPDRAPLYTDTLALCEWMLGRLSSNAEPLARSLCYRVLTLHEAVLLALKDRRREERIDQADEELVLLRAELRLAAVLGYLEERQAVHALARANDIGRQLGGWRRALGPT